MSIARLCNMAHNQHVRWRRQSRDGSVPAFARSDPNANHTMVMSRALELAGYHSSIPVVNALLKAGTVLKGRSALQNAAANGRTSVVAYLLDQGAAINEIPDNPDIIENALKLGAKNALCQAAWRRQPAVVKLLLERGVEAT